MLLRRSIHSSRFEGVLLMMIAAAGSFTCPGRSDAPGGGPATSSAGSGSRGRLDGVLPELERGGRQLPPPHAALRASRRRWVEALGDRDGTTRAKPAPFAPWAPTRCLSLEAARSEDWLQRSQTVSLLEAESNLRVGWRRARAVRDRMPACERQPGRLRAGSSSARPGSARAGRWRRGRMSSGWKHRKVTLLVEALRGPNSEARTSAAICLAGTGTAEGEGPILLLPVLLKALETAPGVGCYRAVG